jgi:hypothetical protein
MPCQSFHRRDHLIYEPGGVYRNRILPLLMFLLVTTTSTTLSVPSDEWAVIEVSSAPDVVVQVAQLSDLHFSVHHLQRL